MNNVQQALQILAQCASQAALPDAVHNQWKEAYKLLQQFIVEKTEKKEEK